VNNLGRMASGGCGLAKVSLGSASRHVLPFYALQATTHKTALRPFQVCPRTRGATCSRLLPPWTPLLWRGIIPRSLWNCDVSFVGWWYKHCHNANLNGRYGIGIIWFNLIRNDWINLKETKMKLRRNALHTTEGRWRKQMNTSQHGRMARGGHGLPEI
jgi:hypothetical protein